MIDTKKEPERDELHRAIWAIADELRGAVDGWDYFTPADVSELLTRLGTVGKTEINKVYENCTTSLIRIQAAHSR